MPYRSAAVESIKPIANGIYDSLGLWTVGNLIYKSSRIKKFLYKIAPLYIVYSTVNLVWWGLYETYILEHKSTIMYYCISCAWWGLWFIPMFAITKILYFKQYVELWELIYAKKNSKKSKKSKTRKSSQSSKRQDTWKYISELLYGIVLIVAYTVQLFVVDYFIPIQSISTIVSVIMFSWSVSWTVFEYRFIYESKDLFQRTRYFERRWLYFLGYGLPFSIVYYLLSWQLQLIVYPYAITLLSLRAILAEPQKSPNLTEKYGSENTPEYNVNNVIENLRENPIEVNLRNPRTPRKPRQIDHRRLRIFIFSEYISTQILDLVLNKWNIRRFF